MTAEYLGYRQKALDLLKSSGVVVGDHVKILTDITRSGIVMPRYVHSDDCHIVIKLKSGYNVGIEITKITKITKLESPPQRPQPPQAKKSTGLPKILLLSTGGTIASKIDYRTGAVTPVLDAQELNSSVPELAKIADIDAKTILSEYSENIMPENWLHIAGKIRDHANTDYVGIILAHGTDTMHYTSAFLSFALAGLPIPVALVGSQRSSDRASSDAALNLIGAAKFLTTTKTRGIYVVMHQNENDDAIACHIGTRVRKNHTSRRGAFETIHGDPAFIISQENVIKNLDVDYKEFTPRIKLDTKAGLIKYHPGLDPKILDDMVDAGYKAVIFEGTGLGHVGKVMYDSIKRAAKQGVFLGMTSQCISGRVAMTVYESGRDLLNLGITPLQMIPEVALVKAMWALGNYKEIKQIMLQNVAQELAD